VKDARVRGVAADLGAASGVEAFAHEVPETDVLVNNLGIFEAKPFAEIPDADWMRFFEVNVMSGVRLARRYVPGMTARKWGRVVFISERVGAADPRRDDSLRHDQDRAGGGRARPGRGIGGHRLRMAGSSIRDSP